MLASIVIPTYNRRKQTERAISNALKQDDSENVQIIVVDDFSDIPFESNLIRTQDLVLRMTENVGAAVCRNKGMDAAIGELIYLLDSDDYFVKRNYLTDLMLARSKRAVFYCDHLIGNKINIYSDTLLKETFFKQIFMTDEGIGQTSSLCFLNELNLRFDESLPKHQDWDLLYRCLFKENLEVSKIDGVVFLDRGDKYSISRQLTPQKSYVWLQKLKDELEPKIYQWVQFNILAKFVSEYKWSNFISLGIMYVIKAKYSFNTFLKRIIQRIILK